jgi:hypothetical protein
MRVDSLKALRRQLALGETVQLVLKNLAIDWLAHGYSPILRSVSASFFLAK